MTRLSLEEFQEWMLLEQIEPFGDRALYLCMGILASVFANAHRGKNQQAYKPADFIPEFDEPEEQTPEQMLAFLDALSFGQWVQMGHSSTPEQTPEQMLATLDVLAVKQRRLDAVGVAPGGLGKISGLN